MALPVLDGNQSATTLSSVVTGGEHIVAHSVVCLGSTAISNITSAVSGSVVSISNFPASQSTTFGAVTGSVSVLNFPSTQTIAGTVTANVPYQDINAGIADWVVSTNDPIPVAPFGDTLPISGTVTVGASSVTFNAYVGQRGDGSWQPISLQTGSNYVNANVQNSVTIGSLPAISGTVTARLQDASGNNLTSTSIGGVQRLNVSLASAATAGGTLPSFINIHGGTDGSVARTMLVDSSGRTVVTGTFWQSIQPAEIRVGGSAVYAGNPLAVQIAQGTAGAPSSVTVSLTETTVTVSSLPNVTIGNSVTIASIPAISGTVTANSSNGSLTTRFGTPTTANVSFATSAVTNANRKYLLIQNVTTGSNVITVGIGFTPTTTQGIQLTAGAGITFESSYIPTGAVYVLSSVTASNFTILEA